MTSATATNTKKFPALEEMGINRAHEISQYSLRPDGADKDILKIRYKRAKGSLLPQSRTYKFGRSLKTVIADGGTARMEHVYEISPFLLKAVAELDSLVADKKQVGGEVTSLIGEDRVNTLLKGFNELEVLINGNVDMRDAVAISAKIARLKAQIASL